MRVFLSYSRQDHDFAGLVRHLLAPLFPKVELWMDERLEAGEPYPSRILEEVDRCDVFVAALSPSFLASTWCRQELARALARSPSPRVLPLLVGDLPMHELSALGVAHLQAPDLRRWRIEGDRLLRSALVDPVGPAPTAPPAPAVLSESLRRLVIWVAQSSADERVRRDLADLATWHAAQSHAAMWERARLLDALAGLHLTRRAWSEMDGCSRAALGLLRDMGWAMPDAGDVFETTSRTDDELGFLGELFLRRALAARQLRTDGGSALLVSAERAFGSIRMQVLRQEKLGQLHREAGTHAQERGDLDLASEHFRISADQLRGLPSEQMHVVQAVIKQAQTALMAMQASRARELLDSVAPLVLDEVGEPRRLAGQVLPHFLVTSAAVDTMLGADDQAREALDRHARLGGGNLYRRRVVRLLLHLPVPARRALLEASTWRFPAAAAFRKARPASPVGFGKG